MNAAQKYPHLMAYIHERNQKPKPADWCAQLRLDQQAAEAGEFAEVASELAQAQADYKAEQEAQGKNGYPYNRAIGEYLGLPIREGNGEPESGYYMAGGVMHHYRLGVARRRVAALVKEGRELTIVLARSKKGRKPVRFARFKGEQIHIEGNTIEASDGKRKVRLSGNWSVETCLEAVAAAMSAGVAYGETARPSDELIVLA